MWDEAISMAISNGIFALLFVCLLLYTLKDTSAREKKYQATISVLSKNLAIVEDIKEDVKEVKNIVVFTKGEKDERKIKAKN